MLNDEVECLILNCEKSYKNRQNKVDKILEFLVDSKILDKHGNYLPIFTCDNQNDKR